MPIITPSDLLGFGEYPQYYKYKNGIYYFSTEGSVLVADINNRDRKISDIFLGKMKEIRNLYDVKLSNEELDNRKIIDADTATFKVIHSGYDLGEYAVDKNNVYYRGQKIPGIDPKSFRRVRDFLIDDNHVYIRDLLPNKKYMYLDMTRESRVKNMDMDTEEMAWKQNSFWKAEEDYMREFDSSVIKFSNPFIMQDEILVKINGVNGRTFKILNDKLTNSLNGTYFKDDNSVYAIWRDYYYWSSSKKVNGNKPLVVKKIIYADPETFQILSKNYAKDLNNVFFIKQEQGVLENGDDFIKITNADSDSFRILKETLRNNENEYLAEDKNYYYMDDKPMPKSSLISQRINYSFKDGQKNYCFSSFGASPFSKGYTRQMSSGNITEREDECNGNSLNDYSCDRYGQITINKINCSKGCYNGACIK